MISADLYCKGAKIWLPDAESVWIGGTITNIVREKKLFKVTKDNGDLVDVQWTEEDSKSRCELPFLRNPTILIGRKDLTSLSYLNEPEVLYNLQIRFIERREIYTYCGIVLVAINPYQDLPIYGNGIIDAYHSQNFSDLDPHIFAVAENAFRRMSSFNENQSIIVSGESGAGKTVSAKFTMRYFALVGGSRLNQSSQEHNETVIEKKVLTSNPVMEALGNAKTIRNDNSSRFGKYLQIEFNRKNQIVGASMQTYLLEKTRVVFQNLGERNYHIFYQLVCHSQSGDDLLLNTGLLNNPDNYAYLNTGESLEIDGVDDSQEFLATANSFLQLGIDVRELKIIFEILAAILHFGNIQFTNDEDNDDGCEIENVELLRFACNLLGCSAEQMEIWLRFRSISTLQETLHKPLSKCEAQFFRDALMKAIYANLFQWIVNKINQSMIYKKCATKSKNNKKIPSHEQGSPQRFISVLDIYGFETFEENSFEQFCINFANEKLQQQFNLHVFKLEQEEYQKEGLEWTFIDYHDNQLCLDLIESKLGLLDLLDEECKMLKGSDENWCCKIYSHHLNKSKYFSKSKMSNDSFFVHHFAGKVQYECNGFIEKNRDATLEEQINLLKASDVSIVAMLFSSDDVSLPYSEGDLSRSRMTGSKFSKSGQAAKLDNSRKMKRTVGYQFRSSLKELMDTLNNTNPHYVRCIKPNDLKLPFTFCPERAVQQLRACGVLETIRLSAAGYPSRWSYFDFFSRYYILLSRKLLKSMDVKLASQKIVQSLIVNEDAFRFGHKKLFFRSGHVAYLEKLRSDRITESATLIQKIFRGWLARKVYLVVISLVVKVQSIIRRKMAIASAQVIRRNRAATKIQSFYRMHLVKTKFNSVSKSVKVIQRWWELMRRIRINKVHKTHGKIILCQSLVRTFICRKRYMRILNAIVLLQSHFRRKKAKAKLQYLKTQAKSVNQIELVNRGLENKIIELTQRLDEREKDICLINIQIDKNKRSEMEAQKQIKFETTRANQIIVQGLQSDIIMLKKELNKELVEKRAAVLKKETLDSQNKAKVIDLEQLIGNLRSHIKNLEDEIGHRNDEIRNLKNRSPLVDMSLKERSIKEQLDHQTLIHDYDKLDFKYQNLCREFEFVKSDKERNHAHSRNMCNAGSDISDADSGSTKDDADVDSDSAEGENNIKRPKQTTMVAKQITEISSVNISTAGDLAIIMQLQMRSQGMSQENNLLRGKIQELENRLLDHKGSIEKDSGTIVSTEIMNRELYVLIKDIKEKDNSGMVAVLLDQIMDLKKRLLQQMDECQKLKIDIFSGKQVKLYEPRDPACVDSINEGGELRLAFECQKEANRKILKEIEEIRSMESSHRNEIIMLNRDKENLRLQMGKLGELIGNMKLTPKERLHKFVQNELSRILSENMRLQDTTDKMVAETIQLKRGLKYFAHRLQKYEGPIVHNADKAEDLLKVVEDVLNRSRIKSEGLQGCQSIVGFIDLNITELPTFIKRYIYDLTPKMFSQFEIYNVPVFVIFMIARKYDFFKEEENIKNFLTKIMRSLRKIIRKRKDSIEDLAMWLSNVHCLLNLFRQYESKKESGGGNIGDGKEHLFVTFNLSEFINFFNHICVSIFQHIMAYIQEILLPQSLCIDAILLYEGIQTPMVNGSVKDFQYAHIGPKNTSFSVLIRHMQSVLDVLKNHNVALPLINQIFVHIMYVINAYCLNNLLFRADLCYFSKGVQIKFNLSNIENWLRNQNLGDSGSMQYLQPMIEAVQLLQTPLKSVDDAQVICSMCEYLNSAQIIKMLHNFNPSDGWCCRLPTGLIANTAAILSSKGSGRQQGDSVETPLAVPVPIHLPYLPNSQRLAEVVIPRSLYLPCMRLLGEQDLLR